METPVVLVRIPPELLSAARAGLNRLRPLDALGADYGPLTTSDLVRAGLTQLAGLPLSNAALPRTSAKKKTK